MAELNKRATRIALAREYWHKTGGNRRAEQQAKRQKAYSQLSGPRLLKPV